MIIACDGPQEKLLQIEFPSLVFVGIRGYRVQYSTKKGLTLLKIAFQVPKILTQIKREKRWLRAFLKIEKLDAVISDNRYGLNAPDICTVFITHQLHIPAGRDQVLGKIISNIAGRYINKFTFCWVPDQPDPNSLAGGLSSPGRFTHIPVRYTGILSRMRVMDQVKKKWELLIMLSGPEPQRSILEKKILNQLIGFTAPVLLVRGLPGEKKLPAEVPGVHMVNHLTGEALNEAICASELVISRAGYTSIMELMSLGKKCILVPTPGQPEQEYLAEYLSGKKLAYIIHQEKFVLSSILAAVQDYPFASFRCTANGSLLNAVNELIEKIRNRPHSISH